MSYHSALHGPVDADPLDRVQIADLGVALHHDFMRPLPPEYERVTCYYSEPPWRDGIKRFNARVGVDHGYPEFLRRWAEIIEAGWPVVLIFGKTARKYLPDPRELRECRLDPIGEAWCFTWNTVPPLSHTSTGVITELASRPGQVLGDPHCGYGYTGRLCFHQKAPFVLSDYDPRCIGRILKECRQW